MSLSDAYNFFYDRKEYIYYLITIKNAGVFLSLIKGHKADNLVLS